jgi:uncharacterized protein YndB with AHSA1/START domain
MLIVLLMMSPAQAESVPSDRIVTEAVVTASADRVWKAFTTGEMQSWMVARGDIDARVGGRMRTSYRKDGDLDGETAIHQTILSLDPERMLSYRTVKVPKDFPFARAIADTWTVIYFDPIDANRTRVTVKMLGYSTDAESQKMRAFFESGNKTTLDALVKHFAGR